MVDYKNIFSCGHNSVILITQPNNHFFLKVGDSLSGFLKSLTQDRMIENDKIKPFHNMGGRGGLTQDADRGIRITLEAKLEMLTSCIRPKPQKSRFTFVVRLVVGSTEQITEALGLYRL